MKPLVKTSIDAEFAATSEALTSMPESLTISTFETVEQVESVTASWNELLRNVPDATTFSTWEWLLPWWRAFGKGQLLVIGFYSGFELVGLAPLCIMESRFRFGIRMKALRFLGDGSGDSDNLEVIARPGWEEKVCNALLTFLESSRSRWDVVELNVMPEKSLVGRCLKTHLNQRGWTTMTRSKPASAIHLPASWTAYLQELSSEDRNNLTRYRKRLEKRHTARFYKVTSQAEVDRCLPAMFELHQQRWQRRGEIGTFADPARRQLYADISRIFLERGWLEMWALDLNERPVAVQFAFRYRDQVFQLQEGFDEAYHSDRVGTLLRAHVLEQLIGQGVTTYDFLGGEPGYKARWAAKPAEYINLHFARKRTFGALYLSIMKNAVNGKEKLRKALPAPAWDFLHHINVNLTGKNNAALTVDRSRSSA